jgi:hypothetical protein
LVVPGNRRRSSSAAYNSPLLADATNRGGIRLRGKVILKAWGRRPAEEDLLRPRFLGFRVGLAPRKVIHNHRVESMGTSVVEPMGATRGYPVESGGTH